MKSYERLSIFTLGMAVGMLGTIIASSTQPRHIHVTVEKPLELKMKAINCTVLRECDETP